MAADKPRPQLQNFLQQTHLDRHRVVWNRKLYVFNTIFVFFNNLNATQKIHKKVQEIHELYTAQPVLTNQPKSQILFH